MKFTAPLWAILTIPVMVVFDQLSKWMIIRDVENFNALGCLNRMEACGAGIKLPGPIDFSMVWNYGISYGLLQSEGIWRWVLAAMMLVISLVFLHWLLTSQGWRLQLALALIVSGAFGNLIDRVRFGAVVDFIDANELGFPWVFNIADSAITVGAILLLIDQFLLSPQKEAKEQ